MLGVTERPGQPLETAVHEHLAARPGAAGLGQLRAPARGRGRDLHRAAAGRLPGRDRAGHQPGAARGGRGAGAVRRCPCRWSAPAGDGAGSEAEALFLDRARAADPGLRCRPGRRSASCVPAWTACRWPSSWPRPAARRWAWTGCWPAWTTTCGCWQAAAAATTAPVAARGHRLESRSARRAGTGPVPAARRVRRRVRPGRRRGRSPPRTGLRLADLTGRLADKSLLVRRAGSRRQPMADAGPPSAPTRWISWPPAGRRRRSRERHLRWAATTAVGLEQRRSRPGGRWRRRLRYRSPTTCGLALASAAAGPGPDGVTHRLARALGHLTYARRFLAEARGHYEAGRRPRRRPRRRRR